jgi:hypothetical protein
VSVRIRPFLAGDVVQLDLQPSQHVTLGVVKAIHSLEDGQELENAGPAWTAIGDDGRILCCYGFAFLHQPNEKTGGHALAWALLTTGLGPAHLAISRFARATIAASPITRIEAVVRGGVAAERKWAELVGLTLSAVMRAWGPTGETHLLYERVRGEDVEPSRRVARPLQLEAMGAH